MSWTRIPPVLDTNKRNREFGQIRDKWTNTINLKYINGVWDFRSQRSL